MVFGSAHVQAGAQAPAPTAKKRQAPAPKHSLHILVMKIYNWKWPGSLKKGESNRHPDFKKGHGMAKLSCLEKPDTWTNK